MALLSNVKYFLTSIFTSLNQGLFRSALFNCQTAMDCLLIFLLLISDFIPLWPENILKESQYLGVWRGFPYGSAGGLSLERMGTLSLLRTVVCIRPLGRFYWLCSGPSHFYRISSSSRYWDLLLQVSHYDYRSVYFSFNSVILTLYVCTSCHAGAVSEPPYHLVRSPFILQ